METSGLMTPPLEAMIKRMPLKSYFASLFKRPSLGPR